MTPPRDRKLARRVYTDAKTACERYVISQGGTIDPASPLAVATYEHLKLAEEAAWAAYLAAIYDSPDLQYITANEPEPDNQENPP